MKHFNSNFLNDEGLTLTENLINFDSYNRSNNMKLETIKVSVNTSPEWAYNYTKDDWNIVGFGGESYENSIKALFAIK